MIKRREFLVDSLGAALLASLPAAPTLRVGAAAVRGGMTDTAGECWQ